MRTEAERGTAAKYEHQEGTSCFVTAYRIENPPHVPPMPAREHEWMAVATAHVYDAHHRPRGIPNEDHAVMAGVVMRTIEGRATARSEASALKVALDALLFQLAANGLIDPLDTTLVR